MVGTPQVSLPRLVAIMVLGPLLGFLVFVASLEVKTTLDGEPPGSMLGATIMLSVLAFVYVLPSIFMMGLPGATFAAVSYALLRPLLPSRLGLSLFCLGTGFIATLAAWNLYHGANALLGAFTQVEGAGSGLRWYWATFKPVDYALTFGLPGAVALWVTGATRVP